MSSFRRRAAVSFPTPNELNEPIVAKSDASDISEWNDVPLLSPIHQNIFRPTSLQQVVDETHFSKNEVKAIYRAFKETSPNAVINKEILREKFAELFPHGDIEHYADLLFDTFDNDALSILCRGTLDEKIEWLYKIYDPQGRGEISFSRLLYVITSMNDLMGRHAVPYTTKEQKAERARQIFDKFDVNKRGKILKEDFIRVCKTDQQITASISALYTILPG